MIDILFIFKTAPLAKTCAEYLKIVESISQKIDLLVKVEFEAAMRNLNQATNSTNTEQQKKLLEDARTSFNKAIRVRSSEDTVGESNQFKLQA